MRTLFDDVAAAAAAQPIPTRRHCLQGLGLFGAAAVLALTGCATPPPPSRFTATQIKVMQDLGFAETPEGWSLNLSGKVLFGFDDDKLSPQDKQVVANIATTLLKADLTRLRVEGHTDGVGSSDYNRKLSLRRAEAVARELIADGMQAQNIDIRGQGNTMPIQDNSTEASRAQNRRVVIIVRND